MQLHTLSTERRKKKIRRGRGGKRGTFSGRGTKGQKARSGRRIRPEMRDLIKKIPKRRGHQHTGPARTIVAIDAHIIAKKFKAGETVTPKALIQKGLIHRIAGKVPTVKILRVGDTLKNLVIKGCTVSRAT